jgi:NAD(P)-dependent dehydrogenase (short-subunit alcohol dehydrogenase family)
MNSRVAIITGAARGIGKSVALRFASQQYRLILNGRDAEALAPVASDVEHAGGQAHIFAADVRLPKTAEYLVRSAIDNFGRLDCLVNAAGIAKNMPLLELDLATWNELFALHATATFLCCQAVAKALVQQGTRWQHRQSLQHGCVNGHV